MSEPLKNIQPQVGCPYVPCGGYSAKAKRIKSVAPLTAEKLQNIHTELVTCPHVNCGSFSGTKSKRVYTAENLAAVYKNIHTREDCPFVECVCPDVGTILRCNCSCNDWHIFKPNLPEGWIWIDTPSGFGPPGDEFKKIKVWGESDCIYIPLPYCIEYRPPIVIIPVKITNWAHWATDTYNPNMLYFFNMQLACHSYDIIPEDPGLLWQSDTGYAIGAHVQWPTGCFWESLEDNNDGTPIEDVRWKERLRTSVEQITVAYSLLGYDLNLGYASCYSYCETQLKAPEYPGVPTAIVTGAICRQPINCWDITTECIQWNKLICTADDATGTIVFYPTSCGALRAMATLMPQIFDFLHCSTDRGHCTMLNIEIAHRPARAGGSINCEDLCQAYFASNKAFDLWPWAAFYIDHLSIHSNDPRNDPDNTNNLLGKKAATFIDDPDARCRRRVLVESVEFEGEPLTPVHWLGFWFEGEMVGAVEVTGECYFNIDGRLEFYVPCDEPENSLVYYTGCPDPIWGQLKPSANIDAETKHIPKTSGVITATSLATTTTKHIPKVYGNITASIATTTAVTNECT